MNIVVIDGLGGGLGHQVVKRILGCNIKDLFVTAVGTNSAATASMLEAGAHRGATGENAVRVCAGQANIIVGPMGIIIPHAMLGEITPAMAEAVSQSRAKKILLAVKQPHVELIGVAEKPLSVLLEEMIKRLKEIITSG